MKKLNSIAPALTMAVSFTAILIMALSSCGKYINRANTNAPDKEPPFTWNGVNSSPIATVNELTENDIESVYFSGNQFQEGRFSFERQEQYTWLVSNLRKLKLLKKADDYDIDNTKVYLSYEIQLKNADTINIHFYDNAVDFGQGYYFYTDANNVAVPSEITAVSIDFPAFNTGVYYDNPEDIEILRSILIPSMSSDTSTQGADDFSDLMNISFNDSLNENTSLYVKEENEAYLLFKEYFSSYILMGKINKENYDTLILACKNQFGTHEQFSVTSGKTTIHPLGHFMHSTQYDEQTGQELSADGFPQLSEWVDELESVYYEPNFELFVNDEQATLRISIADTHTDVTIEDIKALPPGKYTIECIVTTQGEYVKKANKYNSSTNAYWFKLIKQ